MQFLAQMYQAGVLSGVPLDLGFLLLCIYKYGGYFSLTYTKLCMVLLKFLLL